MPPRRRRSERQICEQAGISERTLRRYLALLSEQRGLQASSPKTRTHTGVVTPYRPRSWNRPSCCAARCQRRSVAQIIQILEWEGLVGPGRIRRSSLQVKLAERGYSTRQMRMYAETGSCSRPEVSEKTPQPALDI